MKISQVAAQLYTVRNHTKTAQDFAETIKKLRKIGYESVQISAIGPIPDDEVKRILDGEGMICCATHEPGQRIIEEPQAIADHLARLECKYTAYPHPSNVSLNTSDDVAAFAAALDKAGEVLHQNGCVLTYHNHHVEFRRVANKTILQWLYDLTDARFLQGEIDTYWVQFGGGDSVEWCRKLENRLPLLHLKDYVVGEDNKVMMSEIGFGNLNWPKIITTAEESGCEWFIVEQDTCPGDPFDSMRMSFDYLSSEIAE